MNGIEGKSILITGGAGFIGSNLCDYLLNYNPKIIRILDNLSTGKLNNISHLMNNKKIEFIYGDISNLEICRKALKNINMVCHQAALGSVPRSVDDPLSSHISNVNGFLNILIAAKENNIKRIVYASSSSVYGDNTTLPKTEQNLGKVISPYAATKLIDEIYAHIFTKCYDMECIGLRYFNVFGPRQDPNGAYAAVIPKFINLMKNNESPIINGDGSYSRDFTYIDNVLQANFLALTTSNDEAFGNAFNIGVGNRYTINELVGILKNKLNFNKDIIYGDNRSGDVPHSNADISLAKLVLCYNPTIDFKKGIILTVDYFLNN